MKPRSSSAAPWFRRTDLLLFFLALLGLGLNTLNQKAMYYRYVDDYGLKLSAARRANRCFDAIRLRHRGFLPESVDEKFVDESGLIGESQTKITTYDGRQEAKRISVNPNWAAVLVTWFLELNLKAGDEIAVGMTGSFPAMNIATLAAAEELGLKPIVITSVGASSWGANDPNFTWLDMERFLNEQGLLEARSVAASVGGRGDRGKGLMDEVVNLLRDAIDRNDIPMVYEKSLSASIETRMAIYDSLAGPEGIHAYVNVGGGAASVGSSKDRPQIEPGLNRILKPYNWRIRGALQRYGARGLPVIHVAELKQLAANYDLEDYLSENDRADDTPLVQSVGWGGVYGETVYDLRIAFASLAIYIALCAAVLWTRHRAARHLAEEAGATPMPSEIAERLLNEKESSAR